MPDYVTKPIPLDPPTVAEVTRPWGSFEQFANNQDCTVSLMAVEPGQRLSLQAHTARAELWIVIDDGAIIQVGEQVHHPPAGARIWIPVNTPHRLGSGGPRVRVLEVAFGNWQQADVVRFDDDYARPAEGE